MLFSSLAKALCEKFPGSKNEIPLDCEISDVECDVEEAQTFLYSLELSKANIFELNVFAGLLSALPEDELRLYCEKLKEKSPQNLKEAIYGI